MTDIEHKHWAKKVLSYLVHHIQNFEGGEKYITYGELAKAIGYPEPHTGNLFSSNIGHTLGVMGHLFDDIIIDGEKVPLIQALVVNQNQKVPSNGLREFRPSYPKLPIEKKRDFAKAEFKRIFEFGTRWEKVLDRLNIEHWDKNGGSHRTKSGKSGRHNPYGGEGSPEHRKLRDRIATHPGSIGVELKNDGITEYPLKSGDLVDIVFETEDEVVLVEVKSMRSGVDDIERGLFQCIKYKAVVEAENLVKNRSKKIRSILVIESAFPRKLAAIRNRLEINVIDSFRA